MGSIKVRFQRTLQILENAPCTYKFIAQAALCSSLLGTLTYCLRVDQGTIDTVGLASGQIPVCPNGNAATADLTFYGYQQQLHTFTG